MNMRLLPYHKKEAVRSCAESHADPEVYPRPDGTVYICGEAETVDVPEDPAEIQPRKAAVKALQVGRQCRVKHLSHRKTYNESSLWQASNALRHHWISLLSYQA